jgi:hypothetical protein
MITMNDLRLRTESVMQQVVNELQNTGYAAPLSVENFCVKTLLDHVGNDLDAINVIDRQVRLRVVLHKGDDSVDVLFKCKPIENGSRWVAAYADGDVYVASGKGL